MNDRERMRAIEEASSTEDWQALRRIDALLQDCVHYFLGNGYENEEGKLYDRAVALGYGEKFSDGEASLSFHELTEQHRQMKEYLEHKSDCTYRTNGEMSDYKFDGGLDDRTCTCGLEALRHRLGK